MVLAVVHDQQERAHQRLEVGDGHP